MPKSFICERLLLESTLHIHTSINIGCALRDRDRSNITCLTENGLETVHYTQIAEVMFLVLVPL